MYIKMRTSRFYSRFNVFSLPLCSLYVAPSRATWPLIKNYPWLPCGLSLNFFFCISCSVLIPFKEVHTVVESSKYTVLIELLTVTDDVSGYVFHRSNWASRVYICIQSVVLYKPECQSCGSCSQLFVRNFLTGLYPPETDYVGFS